MRKNSLILFSLLVIIGVVLRLYRFNNPIADWHSWRQSDTSAVSRNFVKTGFDLLHPYYDDISNVQTGSENPLGYRFVEFPIYNFFQAGLFVFFEKSVPLTIEEWGRVVTIISSIFTSIFLFSLVKKYSNEKIAFLASGFFLTLPYSVYYGRVILPDPFMVMSIMGGIYFFDKWIDKRNKLKISLNFFLAFVFTSVALLAKPFAIFYILPMVYLTFNNYSFNFLKKWKLYAFGLLSIAPFLAWRLWMLNYPEGIPASVWLFNGGNIRFKGAFFYWIFAERISKLILGYFGASFLLLGFLKREIMKDYYFFISFLVSSLLYLFVIARGNVQHDYYQILIIPTVSIFLALGVYSFYDLFKKNNKFVGWAALLSFIGFMYAFSFLQIRDYFNINNGNIVVAGKEADRVLPKDALVIAPYGGDTTFLYQINRKGWPVFTNPIEDLINRGAGYLVIASPTQSDFDGFGKTYKTISSSDAFLILKLK